MVFSVLYAELCNHQDQGLPPQKAMLCALVAVPNHPSVFPPPCLLATTNAFYGFASFGEFHTNGIMRRVAFCVSLFSRSIVFAKLIPVVAGARASFLFMAES